MEEATPGAGVGRVEKNTKIYIVGHRGLVGSAIA